MKNNMWSFLAGCVLGSLVTSMLHGATIYFYSTEEQGRGSMVSMVRIRSNLLCFQ